MSHSTRARYLVTTLMWLCALGSGLGVVYAKHEARKAFTALQGLSAERDQLDIEWDRLLLEQSTWATHARIEQISRERLKMRVPDPAQIVIVGR